MERARRAPGSHSCMYVTVCHVCVCETSTRDRDSCTHMYTLRKWPWRAGAPAAPVPNATPPAMNAYGIHAPTESPSSRKVPSAGAGFSSRQPRGWALGCTAALQLQRSPNREHPEALHGELPPAVRRPECVETSSMYQAPHRCGIAATACLATWQRAKLVLVPTPDPYVQTTWHQLAARFKQRAATQSLCRRHVGLCTTTVRATGGGGRWRGHGVGAAVVAAPSCHPSRHTPTFTSNAPCLRKHQVRSGAALGGAAQGRRGVTRAARKHDLH